MKNKTPFSYRIEEIGSCSKMNQKIKWEIGFTKKLPKDYHPGKVGRTIIDPSRNDTYLLKEEIGSYSNGCCRVYRALYSEYMEDTAKLVDSGNVTLKVINRKIHESDCLELQRRIDASIEDRSYYTTIGIKKAFATEDLSCVSLPYMSQGSLRHILSTRQDKRLPEEFIAIVIKKVLAALRDEVHNGLLPRAHKTLSAGDIFIHTTTGQMLIRLAYEASVYDSEKINVEEDIEEDSNEEEAGSSSSAFLSPKRIANWGAAPEVFGRENDEGVGPKSDIWLLGIMALELAYGELPVSTREDLDRLIKKLRKERRFPRSLKNMLIVNNREVTFKKAMNLFKRKEEVFSEMFEIMVRKCLAKKPKKRPTAAQLLDSYTTSFTQKDMERFERFVLNAENNPVPTTN
ncbi:hypothetical protein CQW23_23548 [Capsicum baccatum]|uniref:Protein kinase domain-containing protein n=1 Tax=Capsicum baccatum TaxID=33114 RepID=A0A2G2VSA0_CAPBA|nr:hypothetical protein CQW23_23548 [Capsicum baccatum]